jgi:diguanylate cyclase (GGDEF)-like protein
MSDSETPQPNHEPDGAPDSSASAPANGSPQQGAQSSAAAAGEPQSAIGGTAPTTPPIPSGDRLERVKRLAQSRTGVWAAVAVLCVAAGTVGSLLGAHAVAHTDAAGAQRSFHLSVTSTGIASTVRLATQQEEDLLVSASTFFAANPNATPAEFSAWTKWSNALRRHPELEQLGFAAFVRAPESAAPVTATIGSGLRPLRSPSAPFERAAVRVVPASKPHYYCAVVAELARSSAGGSTVRAGHCALSTRLLSSRDSGRSDHTATSVGGTAALSIVTPVYRGGVSPSSVAGRRAAFVGWLREVLVPGVVLQAALRGHPGSAVRLRYRAGSANLAFSSGAPQPGAQSLTTNLHDGWSVKSFGPALATGVLANGDALALLIGGILASVLLGLLVFVLGAPRAPAPAPAPAPQTPDVPHEDLYDPLTGLPNRALTLDRADRMVARAGRQSGMLAGALFIDIDWFADVNDRLGRAAGDQLLKVVAQRLHEVVREGDTVGRLGSDEFVVLVESAARGVRLDNLAGRIIEALHQPVELDGFGPSFFFTASIGVAFGRYETPDDLLRDALLALRAAKAAGKDRYTLFNANMRSMIESRSVLDAELNAALQDNQFFLLYQPICDLRSHRVVGLETFVRWQHPKQGVLAPADFLPLAEENGLIVPIGRWVLEEACTRAAAWEVAGHRVGVSVNVSEHQLNRDGFATDVRRALQQSGVAPTLLTLEIPETTVMRDVAASAQRLREIKQLGVRIAIDDFGNGYAYRSGLQQMPLDFLKVDRSSLAEADDEDYRSWLLEAILSFGRELSLTVIAKGIETQEQLSTIDAMGCTMAQGFFLGKPVPTDAVEGLFDMRLPAVPEALASSVQSTAQPAVSESERIHPETTG